jgi:hypothetical protein
MVTRRELKVRVLETLESRVKQFRTREELYPLRVPHEPLALDRVIEDALEEDANRFDERSLRARTLLRLEWTDGSVWEAWVIVLPSGVKLYCDSGEEEARILASGGRNAGDDSDRLFLELLADSGGRHFGIEMSGGAPARVRSSLDDRDFLTDVFVNLFEDAGAAAAAGFRADVAAVLGERDLTSTADGHDFRADVARWLERVMP